jgi:hypothetical protein
VDRIVTVKQVVIPGHEPHQDRQTEWLTDRPTNLPSVAMSLWLLTLEPGFR